MGEGLSGWVVGDEAEVGGAECRVCSFRLEGMVGLVEIDLLLAELERPPALRFNSDEAEDTSVEVDGGGDGRNGEDQVVETKDEGACAHVQ